LHILDGLAPGLRTIRIVKDPACTACGQSGEG
jgi:molybdopterin-synthase adenylyltransferase